MKKAIPFILVLVCIVSNAVATELTAEIQMNKVESIFFDPPLPVALIGTKIDDQVNFMTAAWFTRLEIDPYLFGVSIQKKHMTHEAIMRNNCFSISIPTTELIPLVDAVGIVSGWEYDKSEVFDVFYGENENSPMVDGSIVSFECEVVNSVSLVELDEAHPGAHTLFICEVKSVWVNENGIVNGALDYETLNPILWTFSPMSYWTLGEDQWSCFNADNIELIPKKQ